MLTLIVDDELRSISVRLETELFRDEPQLDMGLVTVVMSAWQATIKLGEGSTHALQMLHRAAKRSRTMNISIRYAPMLGVSM